MTNSEAVLAGKTAIVTGAARGLGAAYARALADAGAAVVINDIDEQAATEVAATITSAGGRATVHVGAVGDTAVAQDLVDTAVAEFGSLDTLVTNAGILRDTVLWKMTDDDFDDVIRVHLRGTFTCVRAAAARMREQGTGGRIVCIGSPTGQVGNFGQTNYAAAKAGIVGMTRTWALELARAKIMVNALIPVASTEMTGSAPFLKPYVDALAAGEPLAPYARRELSFGPPEDVTPLLVFLASDDAAEVTGQAIALGGDRLALWSHPAEEVVAFADGGWTREGIRDAWRTEFAAHAQPVGQTFPDAY